MGTLNPKNKCATCSYSWYPRGKARSLRCPSCSSTDVEIVRMSASGVGGVGLAVAALVVFAIFRNSDKTDAPVDAPKAELTVSADDGSSPPAVAELPVEAPAPITADVQQELTPQITYTSDTGAEPSDACPPVAARAKENCAQAECADAVKQSAECASRAAPTNIVF